MSVAGVAGPVGGWLLDAAVGDPRRGHPVAAFGAAATSLERRRYADDRRVGAAFAAVLVGVPALAAGLLDRRLRPHPVPRALVAGLVTWAALGGRSLGREARGVGAAVARGDLDGARRRVPALVGRDPSALDGPGLCRATVESVAENTADAVVAPLLWGAVAGPAGVVAHRCANTLDAMVGHRTRRYARFGWASARLDDALCWLPARVTAGIAVLLAPLVGGSPGPAARAARRDGHRSPSPNAGLAEAAFAGALGRRLGGENRYGDRVERRGPYGDGPPPDPADVERAVRLSRAVGLAAALVAGVAGSARRGSGREGSGREGSGHEGSGHARWGRRGPAPGARR